MSEKDKDWIFESELDLLSEGDCGKYGYDYINNLFFYDGLNIEKIIKRLLMIHPWLFEVPYKRAQLLIRKVLGFDNWEDYKIERNKIYNKIKQRVRTKKRRDSGYTATFRREFLERFKYKCILCRSTERPEIHHLDNNPLNNNENNLCILCNNCHKRITKLYKILKHRKLKIINLKESKNDQKELERK